MFTIIKKWFKQAMSLFSTVYVLVDSNGNFLKAFNNHYFAVCWNFDYMSHEHIDCKIVQTPLAVFKLKYPNYPIYFENICP